jgi:hypothetical protein
MKAVRVRSLRAIIGSCVGARRRDQPGPRLLPLPVISSLGLLVASHVLTGCVDNSSADAPADGSRWCASFEIQDNGGAFQVCGCVPSGGSAADFLEDQCHQENDPPMGSADCIPAGSPVDQNIACHSSEDQPAVETTGIIEGDTEEGCDYFKPNSDVCCTTWAGCCPDPNDQDGCIGYDFDDFPLTTPGPNPDRSLVLSSASVSLTVQPGTGYEDSDVAAMTASASYDFGDCGLPLCPFYLADARFAATEPLVVDVRVAGVTKTKTVADLKAHLLYPMLGNYYPDGGHTIEFKPDSLTWIASFSVSGPAFGTENGTYSKLIRNTSTVTATANTATNLVEFDNMTFDLVGFPTGVEPELEFAGTPSLTGSPPVATGTVTSSCVTGGGQVILDSTATDPNSDIVLEFWRFDGSIVRFGTSSKTIRGLADATYPYALFVMDARGAFRIKEGSVVIDC